MRESWKDVKGYEGLYQVSSFGRVKRMTKKVYNPGTYSGECTYREKLLSPHIDSVGYYQILLRNKNKIKRVRVHRIVAEAFIDNPNELPVINHKDGNKLNNNIDNLEWCSHSHNTKEAFRIGLAHHKSLWGSEHPKAKVVYQFDKNNNFIKRWDCIADAQRELRVHGANIYKCCVGKYKTAGGFIWKYNI